MKDYYSILGVAQTSGPTEIKRMYRKLAIQYHPDKNPDPQAEHLFKEISEAYDVLSDPQKRSLYDQKRENPFAQIFEEAPRPMHRDPAYKRPRPTPPRVKVKTQLQEAMEHYLKYVLWFSKIGLLLTSIFFVDYLLPDKIREEKIEDIQGVRLRRGYAYFNLRTESGKKIKIYPTTDLGFFEKRATIIASYTLIFGTPLSITNSLGTKIVLGYFYRFQFYLPLLLFLASLFSYVFRKRTEFSFNMGVVSALLLILNYIFY